MSGEEERNARETNYECKEIKGDKIFREKVRGKYVDAKK